MVLYELRTKQGATIRKEAAYAMSFWSFITALRSVPALTSQMVLQHGLICHGCQPSLDMLPRSVPCASASASTSSAWRLRLVRWTRAAPCCSAGIRSRAVRALVSRACARPCVTGWTCSGRGVRWTRTCPRTTRGRLRAGCIRTCSCPADVGARCSSAIDQTSINIPASIARHSGGHASCWTRCT